MTTAALNVDAIPAMLRARRQWVCWRYEIRPAESKPTKVPINARTGENASSTDPATWSTVAEAVTASPRYDGIGYVFAPDEGMVGVDLDACCDPETGEIAKWALDVLDDTGSYTERSPSGLGLHVLLLGTLPPGGRKRGPLEMYDRGRYFTMTGDRLDLYPPEIRPPALPLDALHAKHFPPAAPARNGHERPIEPVALDDAALLGSARQAANGAKFTQLYDAGDWEGAGYPSHSNADQALANMLAFWTGRDAARMDRLFRGSALLRPKWDERRGDQTYGARTVATAIAWCAETYAPRGAGGAAGPGLAAEEGPPYLEPIAAFLAEPDPPVAMLFPELLPAGVLMLVHGEPRARKSLAAFELALAAATGTAPFGLARFKPAAPIEVLYIQEEDPRALTRPRLRQQVKTRCGAIPPARLHVSVRRGVDLDDPAWIERLIADCTRLGIRLLVLDAARRLSTKADEGPAKVRELIAVVRALVTRGGLTVVVVHHDVKPPAAGQDLRRRSQRASGGDWFAASECPVHVERVNERESLMYPQDYKFAADPAPFTFTCELEGRLITRLVGHDTSTDHAEMAGVRGKLLDWLRTNGPAAKTTMKAAGFGWTTLGALLDGLLRDGLIDAGPGRKKGSQLYFAIPQEPSPASQDGSLVGWNIAH